MEFGIFAGFNRREGCTEAEAFDEWLGLAEVADDLGIDCFWLAEFHFRPRTIVSAPLIAASAIAARTKQIKLGIAVQLLPLANPIHLAEETATLDHLSKGRLVLGVGRSSFLDAYQGFSIPYEESRSRFFECLEVLRGAWGEEPFSYAGEHYEYHDVNVIPKPFQQPHPPVRIACESRESFSLMGKFGFPILIRHQMPVPELQDLLGNYREERYAAGFAGPNQVTLQAQVYVAPTSAQARADTEPWVMQEREVFRQMSRQIGDQEGIERLSRRFALSFEEQIQTPGLGVSSSPLLFGSPEEVVDRLHEYEQMLGLTGISMTINPGGIPNEQMIGSLRLLADKVIPHFR